MIFHHTHNILLALLLLAGYLFKCNAVLCLLLDVLQLNQESVTLLSIHMYSTIHRTFIYLSSIYVLVSGLSIACFSLYRSAWTQDSIPKIQYLPIVLFFQNFIIFMMPVILFTNISDENSR
eukprot:182942_1